MPFVQGQLRKTRLTATITSACAHCGRPLHLEIDADLQVRVAEVDTAPIVFAPRIDFARLKDPSIIDAF